MPTKFSSFLFFISKNGDILISYYKRSDNLTGDNNEIMNRTSFIVYLIQFADLSHYCFVVFGFNFKQPKRTSVKWNFGPVKHHCDVREPLSLPIELTHVLKLYKISNKIV